MLVSKELNLSTFEFWSGAKDHNFTSNELGDIESVLEDIYPDGLTETQVNDIFWFEEEFLCVVICIDYDEYLER